MAHCSTFYTEVTVLLPLNSEFKKIHFKKSHINSKTKPQEKEVIHSISQSKSPGHVISDKMMSRNAVTVDLSLTVSH